MSDRLKEAARMLELIAKDMRKAAHLLDHWIGFGLQTENELSAALHGKKKNGGG